MPPTPQESPEFVGFRVARVRIRRDMGLQVKAEAEQMDGRQYRFRFGWVIDEGSRYPGEEAWIVVDGPDDGPIWIASGDLVFEEELTA